MQFQTTSITTETANVLGANFTITTFEATITVFCDTCANSESGTKDTLENSGWFCGRNAEFCPTCND